MQKSIRQGGNIPLALTDPGTEVKSIVSAYQAFLAHTQTSSKVWSAPTVPNTFRSPPAKEVKEEQTGVCLSHFEVPQNPALPVRCGMVNTTLAGKRSNCQNWWISIG